VTKPSAVRTKQEAEAAGALCQQCPLKDAVYVPPEGPDDADLEFRGQLPGAEEGTKGRPLVGQTGRIYDSLLQGAGFVRSLVKTDNAAACVPDRDADETVLKHAVGCCAPRLRQPKRLVAMGTLALQSAGIQQSVSEVAGIPLSDKPHIFPVFHPAVALPNHDPMMIKQLRVYWERLARWDRDGGVFPLWELPPVVTNLTHPDLTLKHYIGELRKRGRAGKPIGLDVENMMIKKAIDWDTKGRELLDVGIADGDRSDPLAVCVSWKFASDDLKSFVLSTVMDERQTFAMHNGRHDARVFWLAEKTLVPGYKIDTMELFRSVLPGIPKGLDNVASFLTEFPRHKDEFRAEKVDGDRFAEASPIKRAVYCGHDSFVQSYIARVLMELGGFSV
jgi:uracil-DNA glycosylase family 4